MDIHEYQAKKILSDFGVKIPTGGIVYSPDYKQYHQLEF